MSRTNERMGPPAWLLVTGPIVALAAVAFAWTWIGDAGGVGPLDRAKGFWLIAVPLTLLIPLLTAWAGGRLARYGRPAMAAVVGLGAGLAVGWPMWVSFAGQCATVRLPTPLAPIATASTIVALTMFGAVLAVGTVLDLQRPRRAAVRLAFAFASAAIVFAIGFGVFALLSGSMFFGHCVIRPQVTP
jgi:hypothetical protein